MATFTETHDHRRVRDAIRGALGGWRRLVIAVDGVDAAGKSTLARYLAWQLGMPAVETDLFLDDAAVGLNYHIDQLKLVMNARLSLDCPVIIEGVRVLLLLQDLDLDCDFLVWVEQEGHDGSHGLRGALAAYAKEFTPRERANETFIWRPDDSPESGA